MSNKYGLLEEYRDTSLIEQVKMFLPAPDKPSKFISKIVSHQQVFTVLQQPFQINVLFSYNC